MPCFSALGSDTSPLPSLDSKSTWGDLRHSLHGLSSEFSTLAEKATEQVQTLSFTLIMQHASASLLYACCILFLQGRREEDDVVEKLNLFLDLLQSYKVRGFEMITELGCFCFLILCPNGTTGIN